MNEMLDMGRYGAYVWSSFGLTFFVLVICIIQARIRHKAILNNVRTRISAMEAEQ